MSRPKKIGLILLVVFLIGVGAAIPFSIKPAALYWSKYKAHKALAKFSADDLRNLNAIPIDITLPAPTTNSLPPKTLQWDSYRLHFPPPQAQELREGHILYLTYAQFKVRFFPPFSTVKSDAGVMALTHQDVFTRNAEAAHARPDDIDSQPDLHSLANLLVLISEKYDGDAHATYSAEFDQKDRRGFIFARTADATSFRGIIYFVPSHICCGMIFSSDKKIDPTDIQSFLSALEIEPAPLSTLPTTQP